MAKHRISYRVYYEDTDAGGVVYYANYLKFAERARTELLRSLDIYQSDLLTDHHIAFVVRHVEADLKKPARLDDLITIETAIPSMKKASLVMQQDITCNDNILSVIRVTLAAVDARTFQPIRLPEPLKTSFAAYIPA